MAGQPGPQPHHVRLKNPELLTHTAFQAPDKLFIVGFLQTYIGALYFSSNIFVTEFKQNLDFFQEFLGLEIHNYAFFFLFFYV